jgi:hypothetical protein
MAPATCGLPPGRVPWKVQLPVEMPDAQLSCDALFLGGVPCAVLITRTSESAASVTRKGEARALCRSHSAVQGRTHVCGAQGVHWREREGEMAKRTIRRRGSGVIALIAVLAALAGPSAAAADPGKSKAKAEASFTYTYVFDFPVDASWAEE